MLVTNKKRVAVIGECMIELQSRGSDIVRTIGGDTLNTAVYLSRLTTSENVDVSYITSLGKDKFSKEMLEYWDEEGINTDNVTISETKQTGLYLIETDASGERSFFYWRNDSAAKYWMKGQSLEQLKSMLSSFDVIYFSGISLAILPDEDREKLFTLLRFSRENGALIVFDNNYRPQLWASKQDTAIAYEKALSLTDIALLTLDDELMLYGEHSSYEAISRTKQLGVSEVVLKRGSEDCLVSNSEKITAIPTIPVNKIIDTTAAGDPFSAGYLASRLTGNSAEEAALEGHLLASMVIQHPGAIFPSDLMPSLSHEERQ